MILVYLFTYEGHDWCLDRTLESVKNLEVPDGQEIRVSVAINNSGRKFSKRIREKCKEYGFHFEDVHKVVEPVGFTFEEDGQKLKVEFENSDMFFVAAIMMNRGVYLARDLNADYLYMTGGDNPVPPDAIVKQLKAFDTPDMPPIGIVGSLVPVRKTRFMGDGGREWMTPN